MKRLLVIIPFLLTGCGAALMGSSKNSQHQTEMALHKARTDVEELRCDLNSIQAQLQILENKLGNQELAFVNFKQDTFSAQQTKIDQLSTLLGTLEKQCKQIVTQQKDALAELKELSTKAVDTKSALSQYQEKITEVEHTIAAQNIKIEELSKLKQTVEDIAALAFQLSQDHRGESS